MAQLRTPSDDSSSGEHTVLAGPKCACGSQHSGQQHLFNPDNFPAIAADIRQGLNQRNPLYDALYGDRDGDPTAPFDVASLIDKLASDDATADNDFVFGTSLHQHQYIAGYDDIPDDIPPDDI